MGGDGEIVKEFIFMAQHEEKIALLKKYKDEIRTNFDFYIQGNIPQKLIDNAIKKYASGLDRNTIIGFYDTTLTNNGKNGYVFTDTKVYYSEMFEKPHKIWYDDIKEVEILHTGIKDCDKQIRFKMNDETTIVWSSCFLNKTPLLNFFTELLKMINTPSTASNNDIEYSYQNNSAAYAGGISTSTYGTVNKTFDEEKFHAKQGHGFAAERANNLYDKLTGHDAYIVGDNNEKNGADRIVDGVYIQSKYCATGSRCINECFEEQGKGAFRYMQDGKPMQIEVPADKYDAAIQAMEEKIKRGQIEGVTDPTEAKKIVRKGHFTYEQAKNIAKAGNIESITYDAVNGAIIASSAFGVTAIVTFATSVWNGEDFNKAIKVATYSGLKVGGTAFITSIFASQLSKAGLNSALVSGSETVVRLMGPKASAVLVNAFRSGSNIYGAAAMKSAAKLLRGNTITAGVTIVVLSSFDIANIFRGRISGKQLFKNLTNTATTVASGTGGWLAGSAIGSAILPGVGTVVGGLIGSISAGAVAGKATDKILNNFIEDDAEEMVKIIEKIFSEIAIDYLLNQKEAEKSVDKLGEKLDGKLLKDMFACDNRESFARELLIPIVEVEVAKRKMIHLPTDEQMINGLREVLEEIADTNTKVPQTSNNYSSEDILSYSYTDDGDIECNWAH